MTLTVTSLVVLWYSARVHRNFRGCRSSKLKCEVGILGCEKEQQRRSFDPLLQLLVQLYFGLRRGNLEKFRINLQSGDTRLRERKTKTVLRPTFIVPFSFVRWTPTSELRNFR
ncbi:hypothetical protein V1477_007361 [Vespula maculifrons]|uniref:Secreted protein n=1 Tax=Vespula maculifrons TaxID=7453 RepID=A0ABD2CIA1_VESMC